MRAWFVASVVFLTIILAACGADVQRAELPPAPAILSNKRAPAPMSMDSLTSPADSHVQAAPLQLPPGWVAPGIPSEFDDPKTAPYWRAPDRYCEVVRTWERWRLVDVDDQEHEFSHVRVEYDGVLQFLTTGCSGYALSFYDSEDFYNDGEGPEPHRPNSNAGATTWQLEGRASNLVVEDLTGTGGATLILLEWTGGNHVYRQITFLHLDADGRVKVFGPFDTAMFVTRAERTVDDTVFTLYDGDWQGWKSCMAGSPSPAVKVSFKGGTLHSCNGTIDVEELRSSEASLQAQRIEQESSEYDLHLDFFARDLILALVYCGQLDDAKRVLAEYWPVIEGEKDPDVALKARERYWADVIRTTRASSLYRLLEREFPQIDDEHWKLIR